MQPAVIWFNKNISSTFNVIETIRAAEAAEALDDAPGQERWRLLCTHTSTDAPALGLADVAETEPADVSDDDYVEYCLGFAHRHGVDVFIPARKRKAILQHREWFESLGVRLIATADLATLELLEHKAALYESLDSDIARIPEFRVVNDLAGLDAAYADLRGRHEVLCVKPAESIYGLGFHIIREDDRSLDRFMVGPTHSVGLSEARRALGDQPRFRDLLVMPFLPDDERSVDCLAHHGELVRAVVRLKPPAGGAQLLEENAAICETVRRLTARLGLHGVYNVQFRDSGGVSFLLEINPRMSGGLHLACLSGVALPYWMIRLALGSAAPAEIPHPRTGVRVREVSRAVCL